MVWGAVGEAFLGSAADPQSVAVANIRAAQRVEGAVLQWGGAAPGVDVSGGRGLPQDNGGERLLDVMDCSTFPSSQ